MAMSLGMIVIGRYEGTGEEFIFRIILLNLVHTGNIQCLATFYDLAANEHGFLPKTSKISINTPKYSRFFLILFDFPCFSYLFS